MHHGELIQGELQERIMRAVWDLGGGSVDAVRAALPAEARGAYTTVQTVLNRLVVRGLLDRRKEGKAYIYEPALSEADYLARSIDDTLSGASARARRLALAQLVDGITDQEMDEIAGLAERIEGARGRG